MEATLTLIEKTAFLKGVQVLSSIPSEALAELAARAREVHLGPGDVLYHEGEPNRGVFLVVDGCLEQRKGRALVRILRSRMAGGELWLGGGEPHQYSLLAVEHSHVLHLTTEDVFDAMLDFPEFGVALVQSFALILHQLTGRVLDLEDLLARFHATLKAAGIEPPDPRLPEAGDGERAASPDAIGGPSAARGAKGSAEVEPPPASRV